jgi:hypothetical protein
MKIMRDGAILVAKITKLSHAQWDHVGMRVQVQDQGRSLVVLSCPCGCLEHDRKHGLQKPVLAWIPEDLEIRKGIMWEVTK